jgi:hypothetical protein
MSSKQIIASLVLGVAAAHASTAGFLSEAGAPRVHDQERGTIGRLAYTDTEEPPSREELEAEQERVETDLLRVQRERFEAKARGDSEQDVRRLDREFKGTQQRRIDVLRHLEAAEE